MSISTKNAPKYNAIQLTSNLTLKRELLQVLEIQYNLQKFIVYKLHLDAKFGVELKKGCFTYESFDGDTLMRCHKH